MLRCNYCGENKSDVTPLAFYDDIRNLCNDCALNIYGCRFTACACSNIDTAEIIESAKRSAKITLAKMLELELLKGGN